MRRPPRGKQGPEDANEIAFRVVAEAAVDRVPQVESERSVQTQAAGAAGGRARAANLTPEERSEIAKRAAAARWSRRG